MTVETLLLAAATLIALVAVVVAAVAVRAVRRLSEQIAARPVVEVPTESASNPPADVGSALAVQAHAGDTTRPQSGWVTTVEFPVELAPRVVQGRVVVPPSQAQVIRTALGRPGVRLNVFVHGLARALRAENRDRILALMRREYRHRRRERLRTGRHAVRMARPTSAPSTDRLHEQLLEAKPLSLADRMIRS